MSVLEGASRHLGYNLGETIYQYDLESGNKRGCCLNSKTVF